MTGLAIRGVLLVAAGLVGCTGGIAVDGQGDVLSESGAYNCALEYSPCEYVNSGALEETFTAVPRDGFAFDYWENCQAGKGNVCEFDVSAQVVAELFGRKLPPLTAHFKQIEALSVHSLPMVVVSCDSSPVLPWDRHCAHYIGDELSATIRPDTGLITIYGMANLPFDGAYIELDNGWNYTGHYVYPGDTGATHTIVAQRTGDTVVITKFVVGTEKYYFRIQAEVKR